ncbi:MAG: sialate O-acetylesterase, partial [Sediminibacterium sp.]|nr:sialate O-acetylesterase [Sediminibacterium sp.]
MSGAIKSQIVFDTIPSDLAFIPRNNQTTGDFVIAGRITDHNYSFLKISIFDKTNQILYKNQSYTVNSSGYFRLVPQLLSQLSEYDLKIYLSNGIDSILVKTVFDLVCGDIFIIAGQSNALSACDSINTYYPQYYSPFFRTIGTHYSNAIQREKAPSNTSLSEDFKWSRPSSLYSQNGFMGLLPLKLQYELISSTGIPICFINEAVPGTFLKDHLASNTPSDIIPVIDSNTIYNRVFLKAKKHNLSNFIKAIIWYQGENDIQLITSEALQYEENFAKLYNSWKSDFKHVERIYVFQVNNGCHGNDFNSGGLIRHILAQLKNSFSEISVISSIGVPLSPDICHYTCYNYTKLALRLLPLIQKHIYKFALNDTDIVSPSVQSIKYKDSQVIQVHFDIPVNIQPPLLVNGSLENVKDYFFDKGYHPIPVKSIKSENNILSITLTDTAKIHKTLTYLPNSYYKQGQSLYKGPWVMNRKNNLNALSFFNFPVL